MDQRTKRLHRAICELDEKTIKAMSPIIVSSDRVFWLAVHKARAALTMATDDQRRESIAWLRNHGSRPYGEQQ